MYLQDFLTAFILSVTATAIPCPVMMILINSIVKYGKRGAYIVIISTVLFDLILGVISALSFNNDLFTRYGVILDIFSGMLFLTIAYSELNKDNENNNNCAIESEDLNVIQLFVQVAGLTFFSPIAFACWISTFSINTDLELTFANTCYIITSAMIGSTFVWLSITVFVLKIKQNLKYSWLDRVQYISSAILGGFGAVMIVGI